jgi:methylamine---glutamate N-methyltransferase subunit B
MAAVSVTEPDLPTVVDLAVVPVRDLNAALHAPDATTYQVLNPRGAHALAVGMRHPVHVDVHGHAGYYCAGMNDRATVTVHGSVGTGVAENMMSGTVRVRGDASQSAGATAHGGLLVIGGSASMRCAISLKGADVVVGGDVGPMSAFMAQAGNLVVLGDAGEALGDSIYEARLFVRGEVNSLGSDCEEKTIGQQERAILSDVLSRAGIDAPIEGFRLYGSARRLYHFHIDNAY